MHLHTSLSLLGLLAALAVGAPASSETYSVAPSEATVPAKDDLDLPYKLAYVSDSQKPRVFVLTDILNEPDDQQSVVRYLLYSNEFDTRGLCATSSTHLQNETHPENIEHIVEAYGEVVNNLNRHVHPWNQYTAAEDMLKLVTSGPKSVGLRALDESLSKGAELLIERLRESLEPLWVLIWGGPNTLAQALNHLERNENVTDAEFAAIRSRLRVYAISDQDDSGEWIRNTYPDIFYIVSLHGFIDYQLATWRCMWEGLLDNSVNKTDHEWLAKYIEIGPLGAAYPRRPYGVEGDTPTFLYLIQNGLGDRDHPHSGGWGGRWHELSGGSKVFTDTVDYFYYGPSNKTAVLGNKETCARWRDHFQNDMATRMQWTVSADFSNGTHPAVPRINGTAGPDAIRLNARPGEIIYLDASETFDPDSPDDNSKLTYDWYQYVEAGRGSRTKSHEWWHLELEAVGDGQTSASGVATDAGFRGYTTGKQVKITTPQVEDLAFEYHVILQVTNHNYEELPVRRYLRVKILVSENATNSDACCQESFRGNARTIWWN